MIQWIAVILFIIWLWLNYSQQLAAANAPTNTLMNLADAPPEPPKRARTLTPELIKKPVPINAELIRDELGYPLQEQYYSERTGYNYFINKEYTPASQVLTSMFQDQSGSSNYGFRYSDVNPDVFYM